ncbi:DUF6932 family protein [Paenactinomyces guangxiensis]|uniref:Uncharacterized protein n=1 Tax=Paenactinomyces guangxiensis TaxID=1490290 RepID=A0A7W1WTJ5_9BACL|nr:hypothetical protein [Paenactinomyces guangxiensis]MBA4495717.1 hypothetical protein [Paenactinomyces guangxiensis]MBH8592706.1 hypothetical protein [Paenactinomyces guangxiensis]
MRFNEYGLLAPEDYAMTFSELRESILVKGEENSLLPWDGYWRKRLVDNLEICVRQLWACGIEEIFIDGSFCTDKYQPNDIDGYFLPPDPAEIMDGTLAMRLNQLDPYQCWGWERQRFDEYGNLQLEMWHRYRVELYPHCKGVYSGIPNEQGQNMKFDEFFRIDRDFLIPKGIVKLVKG